jgi:GNAT superfamily N-acetyltransferase
MVESQGAYYAREYGLDPTFEALIAQIVTDFGLGHDPACERCWIAEINGTNIGSIMLLRESADVAKLRLFFVDPAARGLGVGKRLIDECIAFARAGGYARVTLWTHSELRTARRMYAAAGFVKIRDDRQFVHGVDFPGEFWALELGTAPSSSA